VLALATPLWPAAIALLALAGGILAWQHRDARRVGTPAPNPARTCTTLTDPFLERRDLRRNHPSAGAVSMLRGTAQVFAVAADDPVFTVDAIVDTTRTGTTLTTLRLVQPNHPWLRSSVHAVLERWSDDDTLVGIELRDRAGLRTARFTRGEVRIELPVEQYAPLA
jgi:hypothetical protein